ncbi:Hypothetical_protein [Hexamita inflata]|uniref:Hypothetical_protein n=1 Tax=Hexamita inflata TaxID=28002 RepID=A0AA86UPQ7_9EUKA|nr:Hypothetical protein HINF_LOCUS34156 [Hexamita inflata]CAI9946513.1 Hypothetical protein HINF_LOCUS34158 [Hexamita inflata]
MKVSVSKKFVIPVVLQQIWQSETPPISRCSSVCLQDDREIVEAQENTASLIKAEIDRLQSMNNTADQIDNCLQRVSRNIDRLTYNQNNIYCYLRKQKQCKIGNNEQ